MNSKEFVLKDIGQFIMTGISGQTLRNEEKKFLHQENIGGVILFSHNYKNPTQLLELTNSIQDLSQGDPLFIGVDQEGGRVRRFKSHLTQFPPMYEIGRLNSTEIFFKAHQIMANELKAIGVNLSFSPVCDVLTNSKNKVIGDRALGRDFREVSKYVKASIEGLLDGGILSVAKHFPGHGDTVKDSHFELPVVEKSIEGIKNCELVPFLQAVQSDVDMILMAHLQIPAIDEKYPTTFSPLAYRFLRSELEYDGIIISDDMEMRAVSDLLSWEESAVRTLSVGCDLLVYRSMDTAKAAYKGLFKAIKAQEVSYQKLCQKITRIDILKKKYFSNKVQGPSFSSFPVISSAESQQFLLELRGGIADFKSQE